MRSLKLKFFLLGGAIIGGVIPLLFFTWHAFLEFVTAGNGIYLWPSVVILMATDGHEHTLFAYEIITLAIAVNLVLYTLLGALTWSALWVIRRIITQRV
jgi:hypothetical protein